MSYQQYDRSSPYGATGHNAGPARRPPPPAGYYPPSDRPRGQAPMRPARPGNQPPPDWRRPPRMPLPAHQHAQSAHSSENLYDGSAFGGAVYEVESDAWPLPTRPFAQQQRSRSPNSSGSPRRPPQRPQRPDYQDLGFDAPRSSGRPSPRNRPYPSGAPPFPPPPLPVSQPRRPQHAHHGSGEWTEDGYIAPQSNPSLQDYRLSAAQHSHSSIPDFPAPVPMTVQNVASASRNQRIPLGPPPSSRRGPAFYYPQVAPVHPIAEEADSMRGSIRNAASMAGFSAAGGHESYASNGTMPGSIPDYYLEHRDSAPALPGAVPLDAERRDGRSLPHDDNGLYDSETDDAQGPSPEPVLVVRQASLGKKSKPTLTTVKSGERIRSARSGDGLQTLSNPQKPPIILEPSPSLVKEMHLPDNRASDLSEYSDDHDRFDLEEKLLEAGLTIGGAEALHHAADRSEDREAARKSSKDILRSGTGFIDHSSSESDRDVKKVPSRELLGGELTQKQFNTRARSPVADDPSQLPGASSTGLPDRASMRRPPRLNVDAVHEAEARGSLTSLSDLIKRATRLASNLDRGKTASRLGMGFFDGTDSENEKDARNLGGPQHRQSATGSFTDILAAFPPPGMATPPGSRGGLGGGGWPSNLRHSALPSESDAGEKRKRSGQGRRCCGLPLWIFLLLLLLLFLLIAAAVVVPVLLLVVFPDRGSNSSHAAAEQSKALAACKAQVPCANGGTNILRSSTTISSSTNSTSDCMCLCVNDYTGSTCTTHDPVGCSTTTVGSVSDVTLGDELPRLLAGAQSNFSIPLDAQTLLGLFSASDMSCQAENALVTFEDGPALIASRSDSSSNSTTFSATNSSSDANEELDFARIAVLYVFQATATLDDAITAQDNLQSFLTRGESVEGVKENATNVTLGAGFVVDLVGLTLQGNGTTVS